MARRRTASVTNPMESFADRLRRHRVAAGLTQEELAERTGLSVRGISDLERGRRARPYLGTVRLLADALGLDDAARGALLRTARGEDAPAAPAELGGGPPPLPSPLNPLVGRAEDARAVCQLLERPDVRLVNLTGPGGVGKTHLALLVASRQGACFPDGTFFVPLAALHDPDLVLSTVAHTVGLRNTSAKATPAALAAHLGAARALLVLDNFEHLLGAAPAVSDLLGICPGLKVLATSRTVLRVTPEHEYVVSPLALPDPAAPPDLERLRAIPAAALFLERLAAVAPRSVPTEADAPVIAEICRRTEGLPLAIELAAARARYLAIPELAARLRRRLRVLTQGPRDLPRRHQTLRDTIAWSYDLLAPDERRLFRRLAVFAGGWTLEHAEVLDGAGDGGATAVEDGLAALVDGSLVQVARGSDDRARYTMLETIRELAEEQLTTSGEEDAVRCGHADLMLAYTDRAHRGLTSGERTAWARAVPSEVDNVRAALRWSLDHDETERALRIVGNLDWFWDAIGSDPEGWAWSQEALAKANADRAGWGYARALYGAGELAWNLGDFTRSFALLSESVGRFRVLDDRRSLALALVALGLTTLYRGDVPAARRHAREGVELFETFDDPWDLGLAWFAFGEALGRDDLTSARLAYERSLAIFRSTGDPWGIAHALSGLGGLAMRQGDFSTARALLEEGLALRRAVENRGAIATSLVSLGELARRQGDAVRAAGYLDEGLALFRALGDAEHVAWALYNLGLAAMHRGDPEGAATALAECLTLRGEQGNPLEIAKTITAVARFLAQYGDAERAGQLLGAAESMCAAGHTAAGGEDDERRVAATHVRASLGDAAAPNTIARGRALSRGEAVSLARAALGAL